MVKRYDIADDDDSGDVSMMEFEDGEYVTFAEYDALAARLASLRDYLCDQLRGAHLADCASLRGDDFNPHPKCNCEIDAVFSAIEGPRTTDSASDVPVEESAACEIERANRVYGRGAHTLMELMKAYERRVRSDCTSQADIDARPWECAEYRAAADYLRKTWPRAADPERVATTAQPVLHGAVKFYWIQGPLTNYGTTEKGFNGEVRVVSEADFNIAVRLLQKIMARCADLLDEDQFNELDAMTRATDPTDGAP